MNLTQSMIAGRANILLYSIFKTLPLGSKIIFPAVMCPSPLFMALYAGMKPVLVDIDSTNGLIDIEKVKKTIVSDPLIKAVLSVNLYGQRPLNEILFPTCQEKSILLIEDAAQWWSPRSLGKNVDICVTSFGGKKIIDCGGGGIALTNDPLLKTLVEAELEKIIFSPIEKIRTLSQHYQSFYYLLQSCEKSMPGFQKKFAQFAYDFKDLYFPDNYCLKLEHILKGLQEYTANLKQRAYWASKYDEYFKTTELFESTKNPNKVEGPWRYSVLYRGKNREHFVEYLRTHKIDVSCWYPSLEMLGFNFSSSDLKNGERFGRDVINFWVEDMTEKKFENIIDTIRKFKE